mmetsp:Transcript_24747/g.41849  ORF Transcript_24747/g.41849 Transcript_24747/m.41849 type:complete len:502 (-) Transcript_24747:56-1561(-)
MLEYVNQLLCHLHLSGSLLDILNTSVHVESTLGQRVQRSGKDFLETLDGILKLNELTSTASKHLSDVEGLRHKSLGLSGSGHSQLIIFGKLIHTQNGNDILKTLVILKKLLGSTGSLVMSNTNNSGVKHSRGRVKGIHGRVDSKLGNLTGQHSLGVQMGESGGGGGIGQIISGHVHSLDGGNRSNTSGGNTLLQETHISGQSRLVTDSGRNTSKKSRHLRTSLGETENIVDEKQHILSLLVTEVLSDGKSGKGHTGTSSRGLVHLSVHKGGLGSLNGLSLAINLDDSSLNHLVVEIISLTGALSDTGEHRVTTVVHGNIVNKFHDNDSLSDTGTSEESDLTSLGVRSQQVHNLDTSHKDFLRLTLLGEKRGGAMDGGLEATHDRALLIHGLTNHVKNTAKSAGADGDHDGGAGVVHSLTTDKTLGGFHGNSTDSVLTQMLGNLKHKAGSTLSDLNLKGIKNRGKGAVELDIDNSTDNLGDNTSLHGSSARDASLCDLKSHV